MNAVEVFITEGWEIFVDAVESEHGATILWYTYDEVIA